MDLKQKFIGENEFEIEEWFAHSILKLSSDIRQGIIDDIIYVMPHLPTENGWEQKIYGVVKDENIFYKLYYLKEEYQPPLLIDLKYVESDEFLDAMLEKNTIKTYEY